MGLKGKLYRSREDWRCHVSASKVKPTRWYYVLAILIPIAACLGTAVVVYPTVPELPGALEAAGLHNLTQVVVPGSEKVAFPKAGEYAVYYEYRSSVDGVRYDGPGRLASMDCRLTSQATGAQVALAGNYIEGSKYETEERAGVHIHRFSIDQPGVYEFSCQYVDGRACPQIVMAVGPNVALEFLNVAAKPVAAILCGGLAFTCACGMCALIIGIVAYRRYRSKLKLALQS